MYIKTESFQITQGGYQVIVIAISVFTESSPPLFKVQGLQSPIIWHYCKYKSVVDIPA